MKRAAWALSKTSARPQSWVDWLLGVVGIACVLLVAVLLWIEPTTTRSATHFVEAQRWIEPIDTPDWSTEGFEKLAFSAPMLSAANWQTTPLPDAIPAPAQSSTANDAAMARAWIRLRYAVPTSIKSSDKLAIYIPRIMGGAWSLWANGEVVANNAHDWKMQWNRPVYMTLPMQLSAPNTVIDIDVAVPFRTEQGYAVGSVWLGPTSAIAPLRAKRVLLQQTLPMVGLIVVLLLGVWSFHFWWIRRSETQHLYMALAALSWLVFDIQYFHDLPSNAMGAAWFTAIIDASISWLLLFFFLFACQISNQHYPRLKNALIFFTLADLLLTLPIWHGQLNSLILQHLLHLAVALIVFAFVTWQGMKSMQRDMLVLSVALWVLFALGVHDLMYTAGQLDPDAPDLFAFGMFGVFMAFLYANQRRYFEALSKIEQSNVLLNERLAEQEKELQSNYLRLAGVEKQRTLLLERQRLMQDMHDGIGSTLISSLAVVEKDEVVPEHIAILLRECIDELRLVIHSLEPIAHDLTTLLASLRQRLGRRLEASGIRLRWNMGDLPALPWLEAPQALQVLRIMQELLANVVKHAEATEVRIDSALETQTDGTVFALVTVSDNGRGFDPNTVERGRGINNINERCKKIGGKLRFTAGLSQGTSATLMLPLQSPSV